MNLNYKMVKGIITSVSGLCASAVVQDALNGAGALAPTSTNRVTRFIGFTAIGITVAHCVEKVIDKTCDDIVDGVIAIEGAYKSLKGEI